MICLWGVYALHRGPFSYIDLLYDLKNDVFDFLVSTLVLLTFAYFQLGLNLGVNLG